MSYRLLLAVQALHFYICAIHCTTPFTPEVPVMEFKSFQPNCQGCVGDDSAVNITGHFSISDEELDMAMVNIKIDIMAGPGSPYQARVNGVWNLYCAIARNTCSKWFLDTYAKTYFTLDCNCAPKVEDDYSIWIPIRPLKNFKNTVLRIRYSLKLDPAQDEFPVAVSSNFSVNSIFQSTAYKSTLYASNNGHNICQEHIKVVLLSGVCSALYFIYL